MLHKAYNFHITPNIVLECLKPRLIVVSLTFPNSKWLDPSTCQPLKITTLAYLLWINGSHAPSMVGNEKTTRKWWLDDMASYTYKIFEHQVYPLVFFCLDLHNATHICCENILCVPFAIQNIFQWYIDTRDPKIINS